MTDIVVPTIYDYFQRACRRDPEQLRGITGEKCVDFSGNSAVYTLVPSSGGYIFTAHYRCTTCVTLLALCERLAEELTGATWTDAASWTPERLLALYPEVPPVRHDRAMLAVAAVQSAVRTYIKGERA